MHKTETSPAGMVARDGAEPDPAPRNHGGALSTPSARNVERDMVSRSVSKRVFDLVGASALIVFLAPLMLAVAAAVWIEGGPIFYRQTRVGAGGRPFACWKFRTMVPGADDLLAPILERDPISKRAWEQDFKLRHDPRVTFLGRFLRRSSLDELPQLFHVVQGHMSLVGPRPVLFEELSRYGDAAADYLSCRPGLTGLWQVSGRNDVDYAVRVALDREYARSWSFAMDLRILLKTVGAIARRSGAY